MKNKINESNDYKCVLCETGEGDKHGAYCSENKRFLPEEVEDIMQNLTKGDNLELIREALEQQYN